MVGPEEFEAAPMEAYEEDNEGFLIHLNNETTDESHSDVEFARRQRLAGLDASFREGLDVSETLAAQQCFGHVLRG
jgi:hypothetical protein